MNVYGGKKNDKESKDPMVNKILALRDSLLLTHENKEEVGLACKGMYRCSKLADAKCLDGILKKLESMKNNGSSAASAKEKPKEKPKDKKKGGAEKKRAKSRSRSRSKSRSRSR